MAIIIRRKPKAPPPQKLVEQPKAPEQKPLRPLPQGLCVGNADALYAYVLSEAPNAIVPWFLMASYLYYIHGFSLLSDGLYDQMASTLLKQWDAFEHPNKGIIDRKGLSAGSQFALKSEDYPARVRYAAVTLANTQMKAGITIE